MLKIVASRERPQRDLDVAIVIPSRFGSTQFPGKPLTPLRGANGATKSLIQRSWEVARTVSGVKDIWIAADDPRIGDAAKQFGAQAILTPSTCRNSTERCWAAMIAADIRADLIVNLQGDAPLIPPLAIEALIDTMRDNPQLGIATPMIQCSPHMMDRLQSDARADRHDATTVVFDEKRNALYFSRHILPHGIGQSSQPPVYLHMGVYAYRPSALAEYMSIKPSLLEQVEGLEQLRFLHRGIPIRMVEVSLPPGGLRDVNSPIDIAFVETALAERHLD